MKLFKTILSAVAVALTVGCMAMSVTACAKEYSAGDFYYTIESDSTISVYVSSYDMEELVIPETIAGLRVTGVKKPKNQGISTVLVKVVLPSTVQRIDEKAFKDCVSLEEITLPDSLLKIYANAFENCSSLTTVVIPDSVTVIDDEAYKSCLSLQKAYIPDSVTDMGREVFYNSPKLEIWAMRDGDIGFWDSWSSAWCNGIKEVHWNWDGVVPEA